MFLTSFVLALRAVVVSKLVILGILFSTSFILALRVVLVAKLEISGILFYLLALYTLFLTTFFTTWLTNLTTLNLSTSLFSLLKLVVTFFSLSKSYLSASGFKIAKSTFLVHFGVSVHFLNLSLLHN